MDKQNQEITTRLRMYRMQLQEQIGPDDWAGATCPIVATLSDVCDALCLSKRQRMEVLGYHNVVLLDLPGGWVPVPAAKVV